MNNKKKIITYLGANEHASHRKTGGYHRSWTFAVPEESPGRCQLLSETKDTFYFLRIISNNQLLTNAKLIKANVIVKNVIPDIVDTTLFPGLALYAKLRWNPHITRLAKMLGSAAYALQRIQRFTVANSAREGGDTQREQSGQANEKPLGKNTIRKLITARHTHICSHTATGGGRKL
ncbi:hypothetical protein EVAR_102958_1 [Eumeta japonica]|uniref:Uncharacterized protein n=1 Tax=Eumeta variegata TaxID=151549 RepID=A0A4C1UQY0_EUMVA|nr:hypothetical protein EVAR_102958_1 [Eumeta japonica]